MQWTHSNSNNCDSDNTDLSTNQPTLWPNGGVTISPHPLADPNEYLDAMHLHCKSWLVDWFHFHMSNKILEEEHNETQDKNPVKKEDKMIATLFFFVVFFSWISEKPPVHSFLPYWLHPLPVPKLQFLDSITKDSLHHLPPPPPALLDDGWFIFSPPVRYFALSSLLISSRIFDLS